MNEQVLGTLISECGKLLTAFLKTRPVKTNGNTPDPLDALIAKQREPVLVATDGQTAQMTSKIDIPVAPVTNGSKATEVATGCIPCALGHFGTCSGLLNESMRFAYKDGLANDEVIRRTLGCLDELNTMEREDLRPEMITQLDAFDKELAMKALQASRDTRHKLESIKSVEELESLAAATQTIRNDVGTTWMKRRLSNLSQDDKDFIQKRIIAKLAELESGEQPTPPTLSTEMVEKAIKPTEAVIKAFEEANEIAQESIADEEL